MLMLVHPQTADIATFHKGEGWLAVEYFKDGYRGLSEKTNKLLEQAAERSHRGEAQS